MADTAPILYIDAYDSFANNIIALLKLELARPVVKISIDHTVQDLASFVRQFSAVVVGPGPGTVENPEDIGIISELWKLPAESVIPVLGICLGFQSIVLHHGGTVHRLPRPRHGVERVIISRGESIFRKVEQISAIQYHSLHACLGHALPSGRADFLSDRMFEPTASVPELIPLAWDIAEANSSRQHCSSAKKPANNDAMEFDNPTCILMAVKHIVKPFYGVQFHPESICSSQEARGVVRHWWEEAMAWWSQNQKTVLSPYSQGSTAADNIASQATPAYPSLGQWSFDGKARLESIPTLPSDHSFSKVAKSRQASMAYQREALPIGVLDVPTIVSSLSLVGEEQELVVLDSARPTPKLGSNSIIGCIDSRTIHVTYTVDSRLVRLRRGSEEWSESLDPFRGSVFEFLKTFLKQYRFSGNKDCEVSPIFSGGFIGYIDYEACLETLSVRRPATPDGRPNVHFAFVERSIVVDHEVGMVSVQSIRSDDWTWVTDAVRALSTENATNLSDPGDNSSVSSSASEMHSSPEPSGAREKSGSGSPLSILAHSDGAGHDPSDFDFLELSRKVNEVKSSLLPSQIHVPREETYREKIRQCQEELHAGNSYELCLTDQTRILTRSPNMCSKFPWEAYCRLRSINPAPFAAYMRLGSLTLMSSSPERFMSWTRPSLEPSQDEPPAADQKPSQQWLTSTCQFRPIKGTVKKAYTEADGSKRLITLEEATEILSTQKERAENLMIVDLIRHDLHGIAGPNDVEVPQLMEIEEYEHVYQLVSVIRGRLFEPAPPLSGIQCDQSSIDCSPDTNSYLPDQGCRATKGVGMTGIDVLANSLPPGSMTGAPKRRSCELLTGIEGNEPRSVYSGVLGYLDVGGGGDFSVIIRTLFRWDDENSINDGFDTWRVGAGGAITVLSTEEGEWEEMNAKLSSVLGLFDDES